MRCKLCSIWIVAVFRYSNDPKNAELIDIVSFVSNKILLYKFGKFGVRNVQCTASHTTKCVRERETELKIHEFNMLLLSLYLQRHRRRHRFFEYCFAPILKV